MDPKSVLEALTSGGELPFSDEQISRARSLLHDPLYARAAEVEALPEPLALAVLEAAVHKEAVGLAEALSGASDKALAKAAKKALYRLRSKGVAVPEPAPAAPPAPIAAVEEVPPSLVSSITGNGERALIVARPARGRLEVFQLVLADEHGAIQLDGTELSRGQYRKILKETHRGDTMPSVEIPLDQAKRLVAEAAGLNLTSKTPFPPGMDRMLRVLEVSPIEQLPDLPPPRDEDQGLAVRGAALHDEREIAQWLPPIDALRQLALKAQEIAQSPLYVDENQRAAQLRHTVQSMAEAFFDERVRKLYARRLWQMAVMFELSGREEQANVARAEARRLFHAAPGLFSPFGVRLFEKVLALSGPQLGAPLSTPPESGGLIIP